MTREVYLSQSVGWLVNGKPFSEWNIMKQFMRYQTHEELDDMDDFDQPTGWRISDEGILKAQQLGYIINIEGCVIPKAINITDLKSKIEEALTSKKEVEHQKAVEERQKAKEKQDVINEINKKFHDRYTELCQEFSIQLDFQRCPPFDSTIETLKGGGEGQYVPHFERGTIRQFEVIHYDTSIYDWDMWGLRIRPNDKDGVLQYLNDYEETQRLRVKQEYEKQQQERQEREQKWKEEREQRNRDEEVKRQDRKIQIDKKSQELNLKSKNQLLEEYPDLLKKGVIKKSWNKQELIVKIATKITDPTPQTSKPIPKKQEREDMECYPDYG